jgi:hypothetical protein
VISRELQLGSRTGPEGLFYGTVHALPLGAGFAPPVDPLWIDGMERRTEAVPVAASIRDATVIAAVRFVNELAASPAVRLRVYRVDAMPFHAGPLAVIERLRQCGGGSAELIREYWSPSGVWHLKEMLVSSLVVVEEVPPASDRDVYVPRWVLYREDSERAGLL